MSHYVSRTSVVAGLLVAGVAAALSAQGAAGSQVASIADLLNEVKALRADVNQATSASLRTQLLVARLSLQEQRLSTLGRRLVEVQTQILSATNGRNGTESQIKRLVEASADPSLPVEIRKELAVQLTDFKARLPEERAAEQQLRGQESELTGVIADEQNRWSDFNARLDEIERTLPRAAPRP